MDRLYDHDGLQSEMCCKIQINLDVSSSFIIVGFAIT